MLKALFLLVFYLLIAWYEGRQLYRERRWRELVVVILSLGIGYLYMLEAVGLWHMPNPTTALEAVFSPISHWLEQTLPSAR